MSGGGNEGGCLWRPCQRRLHKGPLLSCPHRTSDPPTPPPAGKTASPGTLLLSLRVLVPQEEEFEHDIPEDLGPLQFVKLRKHHSLVDNAWFCDHITVQGPVAFQEATFPCYRWVQADSVLCLPEGTGEGQCRERGCRAWGTAGEGVGEGCGRSEGLDESECSAG